MERIEIGGAIKLIAGDGKYLHKAGTDMYRRKMLVSADEVADVLEVSEKPACTREQYEALVENYIRERYTVSQEIAILRQRDSKPEEFAEYNAFAETAKQRARTALSYK